MGAKEIYTLVVSICNVFFVGLFSIVRYYFYDIFC